MFSLSPSQFTLLLLSPVPIQNEFEFECPVATLMHFPFDLCHSHEASIYNAPRPTAIPTTPSVHRFTVNGCGVERILSVLSLVTQSWSLWTCDGTVGVSISGLGIRNELVITSPNDLFLPQAFPFPI